MLIVIKDSVVSNVICILDASNDYPSFEYSRPALLIDPSF